MEIGMSDLSGSNILEKINYSLNQILEGVNDLTIRVKGLEDRMTKVEDRLTKVEDRLTGLEDRLTKVEDSFDGYHKRDSKVQEITITHKIYNILNNRYPTFHIKILDVFRVFYSPKNKNILTDLDGAILMTNRPIKSTANYSNERFDIIRDKITLTNEFIYEPKFNVSDLIVVEAKHTDNFKQIFKKLRQIFEIYKIIHTMTPARLKQTSKQFSTMYETYITANNINDVKLIFTSDTISPLVARYLDDVNNGLTHKQHYEYQLLFFRADGRYDEFINDPTLNPEYKNIIKNATNILNIYSLPILKYTKYVDEYAILFNDYRNMFKCLEGRVGYCDNTRFKYSLIPLEEINDEVL